MDTVRERFEELIGALGRRHREELESASERLLSQQQEAHGKEVEELTRSLEQRTDEADRSDRRINALQRQLDEKTLHLQNAVKNISALNRVGMALSSELDIDRLVKLLINISVKGMRAEIGYIMLMEEGGDKLVMRAWTGMPENFEPTSTIRTGESVSGMVVKTGQPVLLPTVDGSGGIKVESRYGFQRRSVISAPIKIKGKILGVIELTNKKGSCGFNEDDLQMMQSIANQAAVALENANLYRQVQKSYFDTIRALVQAVEEKDTYTRGHSERVTTFSVKIAEKLGFSERQVVTLRYGGVLHDIGKIGINVNIIQKPGRLTDDEFNMIKNHPLIGERIISPIAFLKDVLPVVSQHHERYDGHGYPLGIDGSRMVPEARVLAVADAYDAMITPRPYRSPLPRVEAIAELKRCSGTQFDPMVVEVFLDLLESGDPEVVELEKSAALMAAS
jgi:HD-GYP domain-containing protein (c-di-GMP phosphodiesterase class II)